MDANVEIPETSFLSTSNGPTRRSDFAVVASKPSSIGVVIDGRFHSPILNVHPTLRYLLVRRGSYLHQQEIFMRILPHLFQKFCFYTPGYKTNLIYKNLTTSTPIEIWDIAYNKGTMRIQNPLNSYSVYRQNSGFSGTDLKATRLQECKIKSIQVEADQVSAPIKYVNTQFGDLRSVTSMLSEPIMDS
jgi:hypothetical protein